jgi:ATP-binding cassette, subfamily B, bacterial
MIRLRPARRSVPYIAQLDAAECGAACLAMVLAYHGHHAPLPEVREACGVSRDGVNALAMLQAAESYGLEATAYTISIEQLRLLPLPAILHWDFHHFVVLERLDRRGGATIVDPARGRYRATREILAKSFTGAVLAFAPTPTLQPRRRQGPDLARYRALIRENAAAIGFILLASLVLELLALAFPVGQQLLVDRVLTGHEQPLLWKLGAAFLLATVMQSTLTYARGGVLGNLQVILDLRLLGSFMRHAIRLPIGFFFQRSPGDLLQRLEANGVLRSFLGSQVATSLLDVFLIIGYAGLMIAYEWRLASVVIGIGCFRILLQLLLRELSRKAAAAELTALSGAGATLVASLDALETLRSTSAESFALRRWSDHVVRRVRASLPRLQLENFAAQATTLLNALGLAVVSAVAGQQVIADRMSVGVFSAFVTLQGLFLAPLGELMKNLERLQYLGAHLARLDDVMEAEPERSGTAAAGTLRGEIRLERVRFRYSAAADWILRDVSVHVHPGELVALVGPSGAGKSTLARILLGMLQPSAGTVLFDSRELHHYDLEKLRRRMGVVLQENELLTDTILANIRLHDPSLPLEAAKSAARLACVDHVIDALPLRYDTHLGQLGQQLSGGERQRLCLARAIAHRPAILVLDEATSALDVETERRVHENLSGIGCTRIVIAHRLATVRNADRILVLEQGRLVQQGTYASLIASAGAFRDLIASTELASV